MKISIMESLGITDAELRGFMEPFEKKGVEFSVFQRSDDEETLIREAKDADVMIIANMPMPGTVIEACNNLKFIDVAFTGVDHVGLEVAAEKKIAVSNASGYSNEAVAELALGMALSISRNMREVEERCRDGLTKDGLIGREIKGKTVGIIGFGKIGRRSAELFRAFGAVILAYNTHEMKQLPDYVTQVTMDELLQTSDYVLLHCPLNDATRGLINEEQFKMMKKTAILINVARGPIVKTEDLIQALEEGTIAAAGIDVFDGEPPLAKEEPILGAPNLLLTPHVAFATKESMRLRAEIVFDNLYSWMNEKQKNIIL